MPVTPRATRLVRVPALAAFRDTLIALATDGAPLEAHDRLVLVPTRAAGAYLLGAIESRLLAARQALVVPGLVTARELVQALAARLPLAAPSLDDAEREVLLAAACRTALDAGCEPPFRLRPGLVSEMLRFYDDLRRHQKDLDTFERLALGRLEGSAGIDRGAERLVRQTRFLAAAFRELERRSRALGLDEHAQRLRLVAEPSRRPVRHVVVAVGDQAFDRYGLHAADWDLLARVPGLERLDVVTTDAALAGAPHERIHALLPGIEEVRVEAPAGTPAPVMIVPANDMPAWTARDREEEVALFVRRCKREARRGRPLERMAIVVEAPLPYVYVAREVCRSAGVPLQMFDALPLAAEPYAAALDLVCAAVSSGFAREPSIALLASPLFGFVRLDAAAGDGTGGAADRGRNGDERADAPLSLHEVADLDRALTEAGYLGELDALERLVQTWQGESNGRQRRGAAAAGARLLAEARRLEPLRHARPPAEHLAALLDCLERWERPSPRGEPLESRHRRARSAVRGTLRALRDACARLDTAPAPFDAVAALVRRRLDGQTFAPRAGVGGVHLVDAESARFGDFDEIQLAGLVESEWPARPRRNIFYPPDILRELGWPSEAGRRAAARARFHDLLRLPAARLAVSTFSLEADALVSPSGLLDDLAGAGLAAAVEPAPSRRIFAHEALMLATPAVDHLEPEAAAWARHRAAAGDVRDPRFRGYTGAHRPPAFALSGLERYQDCPFRFFASHVLGLDEAPDDGSALSPRARGRFLHEVFQRFFEAWDREGGGTLAPEQVDRARALCAAVAEPLLGRLPDADAALERQRLFGSAISVGAVDVVLAAEASRREPVEERWLEYRLEGEFSLGLDAGRRVPLKGVADRVDLLPGRRLRVIDYKSGSAPAAARALQAPVYALCARERLEARDGQPWVVDEAGYVVLSGRRRYVPVVRSAAEGTDALAAARSRLLASIDGISRGEFPARPHDPLLCRACSFTSVCRKDDTADV